MARIVPAAPAFTTLQASAAVPPPVSRGERPVERPSLRADDTPVTANKNAIPPVRDGTAVGRTSGVAGAGDGGNVAAAAAVAIPNRGDTNTMEGVENDGKSGCHEGAGNGDVFGVGGYEAFYGGDEVEEEEEVDQFRAVGGWGTFS